jgi:hypothetical protein
MKLTPYFFILLFLQVQLFGQIEGDSPGDDESEKLIGFSLHSGVYDLKADVPGKGVGYGVRFHIPVNFALSVRLNYLASTASGISDQPWTHSTVTNGNVLAIGGGLVESVYIPYQYNRDGWFPSYRFSQRTAEIEGLLNVTKIFQFHMIDLYIMGSYGLFNHRTELDLLDKDGAPYANLFSKTGWTVYKFDTEAGRREILAKVKSIYDGKYETEFKSIKRNRVYSYGVGARFNVNSTFGIGLEWKEITYVDFDYADGIRFRNSFEFTQNLDNARYLNLFVEKKF